MIIIANIFFVLLFVVGVMYLYRRDYAAFVIFSPYIYGMVSVVVSCFYLEASSVYVFEQAVYSSPNGATAVYVFFSLAGLLCGATAMRVASRSFNRPIKIRGPVSWTAMLGIVLLESFLILHVFFSGSPLFDASVSRFNFWEEQAELKFLAVFNWGLYLIVFFVGANSSYLVLTGDKNLLKRKLSILILVLAIAYYVSWGNKFSSILMVLFMYYTAALLDFYTKSNIKIILSWRIGAVIVGVGFLVFNLIEWQYSSVQSRGLSVFEQVVERVFVLQGHVWWGAVEYVINNGPVYGHVLDEFSAIIFDADVGDAGMWYLMKMLAPPAVFASYVDSNVQFSSGFPAINLISLGFLFGFVLTIFGWLVFGFFLSYLINLLRRGSRLRLFVAGYVYLTATGWLMQGSPHDFFNLKLAIILGLLVFGEIVVAVVRKRRFSVGRGFV